jgi:hypothetical protein
MNAVTLAKGKTLAETEELRRLLDEAKVKMET